jgi:GntR family transcriptional repressor for pyruvate dehydrogenase complex
VQPTYLYQELAREIERYIRDNRLQPGDTLPSERDLCTQLAASRPSLREALRMLELVGLVETRRGGRTVVGTFDLRLLTEWVGRSLPTTERTIRDLLDVREALEVRAIELAAVRISDEDLALLEENLARTKAKLDRGEEVLDEDVEFHDTALRATGNVVLERFSDVIAGLLRDFRKQVLSGARGGPGMLRQHREIYLALVDGDAERAAQAMGAHLTSVSKFADLLLRDGRLSRATDA